MTAKPPCVLVYTAGHTSVYDDIRTTLSSMLKPFVYTVYNLSPENIRKPHWIDPNSACLIITDIRDLDDAAWKQLQAYLNRSGKIIFVCQKGLLTTDSSGVQTQMSLLRSTVGERAALSVNKDMETFLTKAFEKAQLGEVLERYQWEDHAGGPKNSLVLSKEKAAPLLLCLEKNGAQSASAIYWDASIDEIIKRGSRILAEPLSRIGIKLVDEVAMSSLSTGHFFTDEQFLNECKSLRCGAELGDAPKLLFQRWNSVSMIPLPAATADLLPIEVRTRDEAALLTCAFDTNKYYAKLNTLNLGRNVLFIPVTTTTIHVSRSLSDALPGTDGMCVIARQQLRGQGRGGNEYISPAGGATFNFTYSLPASAALAKNPSFIQHVACVAMVAGVHELSGVEDFPLRIKWPNDFYFKRSAKIGGMLVSAKTNPNSVEFDLGIGINVTNADPTTCLNNMITPTQMMKYTEMPAAFSIEEVIAMCLTKFECFVNMYENKGPAAFLEHYYKYWLHSNEEVTLANENERVVIRGLDKNGFLECSSKKDPSKLYSVSDNGNTFDMMNAMIKMKMQ